LSGAEDWDSFLEANNTQAFIVIQDGAILYENYFNGTQRDSIVTSFSVAKSFTSALIGIAIQEGYIHSVDDPITTYLPELAKRDPRFNEITIRHLLLMASGLEYENFRPLLFNSDDILTSYYPDQRQISLENTHIIAPPGQYFRYNKYHPQLLGMILERATGMPVTRYLQTKIWDVLGMEFDGSWSTDSEASDFEKMETGVNARAIDFAKFGVLFLNGGNWQGHQVISKAWVEESTQPFLPENYADYYPSERFSLLPGQGYYTYMWWGMAGEGDAYDFTAEGNKGQFIYVSPQKNLVIVRNGTEYGIPSEEWLKLFYEFARRF
jgi:CubicO group peptidase (beta-lactamase class C family)